ncbi:MAG: hypothetical protein HY769_04465 [Candidatus Stahlbacteria bacterium]|nr:hypothetical protein [Candidatus Stahlbacteria bacterium]
MIGLIAFIFLQGEFLICTTVNRQWNPAVAFDGEKYLVVWEDDRLSDSTDIWGQFVSKFGTLIDTNFPICVANSYQIEVDVAFGDSNYLVAWKYIEDCSIWGQIVSLGGKIYVS